MSGTQITNPIGDVTTMELRVRWENAIRALMSGPGSKFYAEASRSIADINEEWARRRADPDLAIRDQENYRIERRADSRSNVEGETKPEDILQYMGYRVGRRRGVKKPLRQEMLKYLFTTCLPPVLVEARLALWGEPGTAARLEKMAEHIVYCIDRAVRSRDPTMLESLRDWRLDLIFLKENLYDGVFDNVFEFPRE